MGRGKDTVQIYLREIGEIALLTREDEIRLARKAAKGDEKARIQLIKANLRLVVKIARRYMYLGLPLLDLVEEGNLGLMRAVEKFDVRRGSKLSTYASWWIRQHMLRALANQGKMIRIPVYMVEKIQKVRRKSEEITQRLGRTPRPGEIAEALKISEENVINLLKMDRRPRSLFSSIDDEGMDELIKVIEDVDVVSPSKMVSDKVIRGDIEELFKQLSPREAGILNMRFGLSGKGPKTLTEIGKKYGVTRERIRQIQQAGLRKLKEILIERNSNFLDF